jgi:hypothetical protein
MRRPRDDREEDVEDARTLATACIDRFVEDGARSSMGSTERRLTWTSAGEDARARTLSRRR